ncbi:UBX domain-containing protein 6 [Coccinella septempunctata]|uniref:UBX domain-containing protein 6 n=1 Tax=Coccinella septempunctata TaxID=41139 RepID=UPI001D065BA2|nr:UBX domain-containing protein 6 [Coccinella septempunctata]
MADKIKKFFAKKKLDAKFKLAGPGHKLTESANTSSSSLMSKIKGNTVAKRQEPTDATRQAAEAALLRMSGQRKDTAFNTSLAAIQAQVRKELEAEKKSKVEDAIPHTSSNPVHLEASPHLAVNGVYFRCPLINEDVLTKDEWRAKVREFLFQQLEEERGLTACLIIHSCNFNRTKVTECVDVLVRYLDNIIGNPSETKFHKIRCSNATFRDKVLPILGATELLFAAGFRPTKLENNGIEEDFWVFNPENIEGFNVLEFLRESLKSADRVELELDRNTQVLSPGEALRRIELPSEFYALSAEEIKREQQLKSEAMEKQMQLRTKAMREKEELREIRKYKFALIRVRFPDGLYLQGTFSVYEKFSEVVDFVQSNLEHELPFVLTAPTGHKFEPTDYDQTLVQLKLVPASILNFQFDGEIVENIASVENLTYLKPEVMMTVQSL